MGNIFFILFRHAWNNANKSVSLCDLCEMHNNRYVII